MRALVALLLVAGCGGSGGGPDTLPPTGLVVFPPRGALTDAPSVPVTGTAGDDRGIASVTFGAVEAFTTDGFRTWSADVPLAAGVNVLAGLATDGAGNLTPLPSTSVTRAGVVLAAPSAIVVAPDGRALVLDATLRTLLHVDLATGDRAPVLAAGPGSPVAPSGLALEAGRAILCDTLARAVVALDLTSGLWSLVSDDVTGTGDPLGRPQSVALVTGGRVAVADGLFGTIVLVDLANGNRTALATMTFTPLAIAFDAANQRVLVLGADRIMAVDLLTGAVSVLTAFGKGSGPQLANATALCCDASGTAFVTDSSLAAVLAVDPVSGSRAFVSSPGVGGGTPLSFPRGIAPSGQRLLVVDSVLDAVVSVDQATGDRQVVSFAFVGTGAPLLAPRDVAATPSETLVVDLAQGLVAVEDDGDRRLVSGPGFGSGPALVTPLGVSAPRDGTALLADTGAGTLFGVDLATGARTALSTGFLPTDAAFFGSRILATDSALGALVEVDPATGTRTTLVLGLDLPRSLVVDEAAGRAYVLQSGASPLVSVDIAAGTVMPMPVPGVVDPRGLALDAPGRRLFLTDDGADTLFGVTLPQGILYALAGAGPRYVGPTGITYDARRRLLVVADGGRGVLFAVEPASGARVIISK